MAGPWERYAAAPAAPAAPTGPWAKYGGGASSVEDGRLNTVQVTPQAAPFAERFGATQLDPPSQQSKGAEIALGFMNQGSAASQGTTPNVQAQMPNLISDDTHESDAGELLFRDPKSGQLVPTDQNKHVALRDPADNRIKVFARTAETDEGRLSAGGRILATGMATGAPVARPAIPTPTAAQATPKASDIFATAKPLYREFDEIAANTFVAPKQASERIVAALNKANQPRHLAGEVHDTIGVLTSGGAKQPSALQKLEAEMNGLPAPGGGNDLVPLAKLREIKELVGQSSRSNDSRVRAAAAVASKEINKIIDEISPDAGRALKKADAIFSSAKSVQDLQRKADVADLRAGRAGYGGNAVNSMRQVLSPIVQRSVEGKTTGFKPNEIEAMRQIVEGTPATNALRLVGQVSPNSGLGTIRAAGAGGTALAAGASGGMALAIPAIGAASNKLATVLTGKQIDRLKELVAKRSPAYAEAVKKSVDRYEKAQIELASKPTPAKLAAYASASRALSAGLAKDGISISSGDLMKALQLGGPGRAEEEQ